MKKPLIAVIVLVLLASCGGEGEVPADEQGNGAEQASEAVLPEIDMYLIITDSIGIEMGDSNYVLGQPVGAVYTPGGDIAVLDIQKMGILMYSPEGEYIRTIGREGSGPGEFRLPIGFSFTPEGGLIVSDQMSGKLTFFDSQYNYASDLLGFYPSPPQVVVAADSGAFTGLQTIFEQNEEGMFLGFRMARWEGETEPSIEYFSSLEPFDPSDIAASIKNNVFFFTALPDGRVFRAPMSTEEFIIEGYMPDGTSFLYIEDEDFQKARKTYAEIQEETDMVNQRMDAAGAAGAIEWEPDPFRSSISGIYIDGQERLWARAGTYREVLFKVYDMDGRFLFNALLDYPGDVENLNTWMVTVDQHGFLGFDAMPEDYARIYIIEEASAELRE